MNVLIMPPHSGHLDQYQILTYLHVGFVITLIPMLALVLQQHWKRLGEIA